MRAWTTEVQLDRRLEHWRACGLDDDALADPEVVRVYIHEHCALVGRSRDTVRWQLRALGRRMGVATKRPRLTPEVVCYMTRMLVATRSAHDVAEALGVNVSLVRDAVRGRDCLRHVAGELEVLYAGTLLEQHGVDEW